MRKIKSHTGAEGTIALTAPPLRFGPTSPGAPHLEGSLHAEALEVHRPQRAGGMRGKEQYKSQNASSTTKYNERLLHTEPSLVTVNQERIDRKNRQRTAYEKTYPTPLYKVTMTYETCQYITIYYEITNTNAYITFLTCQTTINSTIRSFSYDFPFE